MQLSGSKCCTVQKALRQHVQLQFACTFLQLRFNALKVTSRGQEGDWLALFLQEAMQGFPEWVGQQNLDTTPADPRTFTRSASEWSESRVNVTVNFTNQYFEGYSNPELYDCIVMYGRMRDWEDTSRQRMEADLLTEGVTFGGDYVRGTVTADSALLTFEGKGAFVMTTAKEKQCSTQFFFTITANHLD